MVKKMISISTLVFSFVVFVCGLDFINLQNKYAAINNVATEIAYYIAKSSRADKEYINNLENRYQVQIIINNKNTPLFGEECNFTTKTYYSPLALSFNQIPIYVTRLTVLGYYG